MNNHQQPDDFYRDLLAKALGRSRADLFGDEGAYLEPWAMVGPAELPHDVAGFIGRSGETISVAACSAPVKARMARSSPSMGHDEIPSTLETAAVPSAAAWPAGGSSSYSTMP